MKIACRKFLLMAATGFKGYRLPVRFSRFVGNRNGWQFDGLASACKGFAKCRLVCRAESLRRACRFAVNKENARARRNAQADFGTSGKITRRVFRQTKGFEIEAKYYERETTAIYREKLGLEETKAKIKSLDEPNQPTMRRYETNDITTPKLAQFLAENPNGLLQFRDELTGWLKSLEADYDTTRPHAHS
jgi:hypothetical protein